MKIVIEKSLRDFDFWGGAVAWAQLLTPEELDKVEEYLEEIFELNLPFDNTEFGSYGAKETAINDMFWFEFAYISNYLWDIDDKEEAWVYLNQRRMQTKEEVGYKVETES